MNIPIDRPVLNISAYKFIPLQDTLALRDLLLQNGLEHDLKGTVLLSQEGINLFLAGAPENIDGFLAQLRSDVRFGDLQTRQSWSATAPFAKLLVKIRDEIIRMNHPAISPVAGRAPAVDAITLKRWLDCGHDDQGRQVVMLDTRNAFETEVGTFKNAVDWRIDKFTEFPQAVMDHRETLHGKTVVSFCTGGIRCEKAAIYMQEAGIDNVYQLDGGILKYFEACGQAHFDGECFVFDDRRAVDAALKPRVTAGATRAEA